MNLGYLHINVNNRSDFICIQTVDETMIWLVCKYVVAHVRVTQLRSTVIKRHIICVRLGWEYGRVNAAAAMGGL